MNETLGSSRAGREGRWPRQPPVPPRAASGGDPRRTAGRSRLANRQGLGGGGSLAFIRTPEGITRCRGSGAGKRRGEPG